jgi:phosphohistidine swiveling domain-containing protein
MTEMIRTFDELLPEEQSLAGGKGGTLARLYQAGYPVPDGFVILPGAFADDQLRAEAWAQVQMQLEQARKSENGTAAFAVRSSALSEDSAFASFAGEFETVLDVHTDEMIRAAIHTVRWSRHSERVRAYSEAKGMEAIHDMAVVVQGLVRAELSGVLFTADPVTGSHRAMIGNYVYGSGEALVSGEAEPYTFTLARPKGRYEGPSEMKRFARKLYMLADRLQKECGCPQDIEWAVANGQLFLLQSRPITTLIGHDPATGEYNASLTGDYLWSNTNLGEAFIDVLTPFTYSVALLGATDFIPGHLLSGNICGRLYFNVSMIASTYGALGLSDFVLRHTESSLGRMPEGVEIPMVPLSLGFTLTQIVPRAIKTEKLQSESRKKLDQFLASTPAWCREMHQRIRETSSRGALASLWRQELEPRHVEALWIIKGAGSLYVDIEPGVRRKLTKLVGAADANALLSNACSESEVLASMGPVVNLFQVAKGKMSRQAYLEQYGHRGPHEMELSIPQPFEDAEWLDRQLAAARAAPAHIHDLLGKKHAEFDAAWQRLQDRYPRQARSLRKKIDRIAQGAHQREAARSEGVRVMGLARTFALRAGELTGIGEDIFFLTIEEVLDLLSGDDSCVRYIPARRETHARYEALPPLPALIRGRFDPFQWASNPQRRTDFFDARAPSPGPSPSSNTISGFPGAAGRVEGVVRRLRTPEEGHRLRDGEILVTEQTNVGWTLLFPRAAAVVTDVGAPLSHAAIIARELGIPAVVGCGDATMRLATGDRVRVDGGQGIVEILETQ